MPVLYRKARKVFAMNAESCHNSGSPLLTWQFLAHLAILSQQKTQDIKKM